MYKNMFNIEDKDLDEIDWDKLSKKTDDDEKILYKWHPVSNLYPKKTLLYKILKFLKLKKEE